MTFSARKDPTRPGTPTRRYSGGDKPKSSSRFDGEPENMQIARRLRAMIVNLTQTLPAQRHSALRKELELLDRTIEKLYVLPEDLKLASIPDLQGLGGSSHSAELS